MPFAPLCDKVQDTLALGFSLSFCLVHAFPVHHMPKSRLCLVFEQRFLKFSGRVFLNFIFSFVHAVDAHLWYPFECNTSGHAGGVPAIVTRG